MEYCNGILNCSFRSGALYCVDYYTLSFLAGSETGLVHNIVDVRLSLSPGLCLHVFHELLLRFSCSHSRNLLDLLEGSLTELFVFFRFLGRYLNLVLEVFPDGISLLVLASEF